MGLNYTCKNCKIQFLTSELQRNHYKSDWHHYNLKRRVINLPPLSAEEFCQRVTQTRTEQSNALQEQRTCFYCQPCRKSFSCTKTHKNHINSKKHKENLALFDESKEVTTIHYMTLRKMESTSTIASLAAEVSTLNAAINSMNIKNTTERSQLGANDCLFCKEENNENLEKNLEHMLDQHGFHIPNVQYCLNIEALLIYLGKKISNSFLCLRCNDYGKVYTSMEAVRKHMIDKGHCFLVPEEMFYNEYKQFYDYDMVLNECDIDTEIDSSDCCVYEMVLPSGAIVGNRLFLRYYKQHLPNNYDLVPIQDTKKIITKSSVTNEYRIENDELRRRRDIDIKMQLNLLSSRLRP